MDDLIRRAYAIEALCHNCAYYTDAQCKTDSGYWCESGAMIREDIPSAEAVPQLKQTDTLIIADALMYLVKDTERHELDRTRADALRQQFLKYGASMCKGGDDE